MPYIQCSVYRKSKVFRLRVSPIHPNPPTLSEQHYKKTPQNNGVSLGKKQSKICDTYNGIHTCSTIVPTCSTVPTVYNTPPYTHHVLLVRFWCSEEVHETGHGHLLLLKVIWIRWFHRLVCLVLHQRRQQLEQSISLGWEIGRERARDISKDSANTTIHSRFCHMF